jgi:hypothetical protein
MPLIYLLQIYQPEEEEEEVEVVKESKEDTMKAFEKAARRLDNSKLVCTFQCF